MSAQALSSPPSQLSLDMFTAQQLAELVELASQKPKKRASYRRTPVAMVNSGSGMSAQIDLFSDSVFDAPFGPNEDKELSVHVDVYAEGTDDEKSLKEDDESVEWSESAIEQLHEGMLMYSLRLLNARGNGKEKKDLLKWIFDPAAMAVADSVNADSSIVWKFIQPSDVPFSFELCCRLAGYYPERVREGLKPILKDLGLGALFKEIEHAQEQQQQQRAAGWKHPVSTGDDYLFSAPISGIPDSLDICIERGAGKCLDSGPSAGPARSPESKAVRV